MATEKQQAARERNWMLFRIRGALAAFNHQNLSTMTQDERAAAYKAEAALYGLLAVLKQGSK